MEDCNFFNGISRTLKCFIIACVDGMCVYLDMDACVPHPVEVRRQLSVAGSLFPP